MGSELVKPTPHVSYTEQFYIHFPYYLAIGMTYDQYWNDDCALTKYYRKADEIKRSQKNQELWLQGMYIYEALCDVSPILHAFAKSGTKPRPYPERPYAITKSEIEREGLDREAKEKANRERAKATFMAWASRLKLPDSKDKGVTDNGDNDRRSSN
jgi:hypothetical protein